jgi:uncharacterized OB-fold protein
MIDRWQLRDIIYALDGDDADIPFWEACGREQFLLHRCGVCERHYWPAAKCVDHGGQAMAWVPASGRGEVHVWTIQRKAHSPDWTAQAPYNVCVIRLEEGPYFHSNVLDCPPEEMATGMKVDVTFRQHPNGMTVPAFRRSGTFLAPSSDLVSSERTDNAR